MLTPELLALTVSREPRFQSLTRGDAVLQLLTHAAHHRGETAMLLSEIGGSPGDLDYIFFALERGTSGH
jgi:uncharacterized damage-inducible protein DinB